MYVWLSCDDFMRQINVYVVLMCMYTHILKSMCYEEF